MQVCVGAWDNKAQGFECTAQSDAVCNVVIVRYILIESSVHKFTSSSTEAEFANDGLTACSLQ